MGGMNPMMPQMGMPMNPMMNMGGMNPMMPQMGMPMNPMMGMGQPMMPGFKPQAPKIEAGIISAQEAKTKARTILVEQNGKTVGPVKMDLARNGLVRIISVEGKDVAIGGTLGMGQKEQDPFKYVDKVQAAYDEGVKVLNDNKGSEFVKAFGKTTLTVLSAAAVLTVALTAAPAILVLSSIAGAIFWSSMVFLLGNVAYATFAEGKAWDLFWGTDTLNKGLEEVEMRRVRLANAEEALEQRLRFSLDGKRIAAARDNIEQAYFNLRAESDFYSNKDKQARAQRLWNAAQKLVGMSKNLSDCVRQVSGVDMNQPVKLVFVKSDAPGQTVSAASAAPAQQAQEMGLDEI
jgi:hypothetical protein